MQEAAERGRALHGHRASPSRASPTTTPARPPRRRRDVPDRADRRLARARRHATRSTRASLPGNIEHFTGVAQVPIGIAGPLLVDGEHAQGEFYVPLATAEGTLVASYNRGMKLLHEAGGVKTTILDDRMQRAPAFLFESAREARDFGEWLDEHFDDDPRGRRGDHQARASCRTSSSTRPAASSTRASTTRPATPRARTSPARRRRPPATGSSSSYPGDRPLLPRGATSPPTRSRSQINMLRTRGKRVVAEAIDPRRAVPGAHALEQRADVPRAPGLQPRRLHVGRQQQRRPLGQRHHRDVHRHRAGRRQRRRVLAPPSSTPSCATNGDYYYSVTIPSLIVGDLRRRHRAGHPARVPRAARLLRRRARCASSPRSSRRPCCAASSRSARRSSRRSGSTPTTSTAATGPSDRRGRSPSGRPSVAMKISPIPAAISVLDL